MMCQLKILTRKIYKIDRKRNEIIFPLPVLTINVSVPLKQYLDAHLNTVFEIKVKEFEISPFSSESSGILYVDSPLMLYEADDNVWHIKSVDRNTNIYRRD